MPARLSVREIKRRLRSNEVVLEQPKGYTNTTTPVRLRCIKCNHKWEQRVQDALARKYPCPACRFPLPNWLDETEVKRRLSKQGIDLLGLFKRTDKPVRVRCQRCRHLWKVRSSSATGCPVCSRKQSRLSVNEVSHRLQKRGLRLASAYTGTRYKIVVECLECGYKWTSTHDSIFSSSKTGTICPKCRPVSMKEEEVRDIIEKITRWRFPKSKPEWLRGRSKQPMELDGYNKRHQVAFEFQGPRHYLPWKGELHLAYIKRNDERKRQLCRRHGVFLVRIPYWKQDVEGFIISRLHTRGLV